LAVERSEQGAVLGDDLVRMTFRLGAVSLEVYSFDHGYLEEAIKLAFRKHTWKLPTSLLFTVREQWRINILTRL
jgi:hypothetical protein